MLPNWSYYRAKHLSPEDEPTAASAALGTKHTLLGQKALGAMCWRIFFKKETNFWLYADNVIIHKTWDNLPTYL